MHTQQLPDIELVADYGTNQKFLRLHIDVNLSDAEYDKIKGLMDQGRFADAKADIETIDPHLHYFTDIFFYKLLKYGSLEAAQSQATASS